MSSSESLDMSIVKAMLETDDIFNGLHNNKMVPFLWPVVDKLPTILKDVINEPATLRHLAIARHLFIGHSQLCGCHFMAEEAGVYPGKMIRENWNNQLSALRELRYPSQAPNQDFTLSKEDILMAVFNLDAEVITAMTPETTVLDVIMMQPSAVCFNPG